MRRVGCAMIVGMAGVTSNAEAAPGSTIVSVDVGTQLRPVSGDVAMPSLGLRLGRELDLKVARLTPEVGVIAVPDTEFLGVIGGGRLSIGRLIEPGVYAHVGYGGSMGNPGWLTYDGGLALDLVISKLRVGAHGGVEVRSSREGGLDPWLTAGLHTGVKF